jgi:hypothetical protein
LSERVVPPGGLASPAGETEVVNMSAGRSSSERRPPKLVWRSRANRLGRVLALCGAILTLGWVLAACGVTVGVTETLTIDEPLGSAAVTDVEIAMGAGELSIVPGAIGLASGSVRYNVASWAPELVRGDGRLSIKQDHQRTAAGLSTEIVNDWNLELGKAPMRLRISAGAYDGSYDLSGLTLQYLSIKDGAAKSQVMFNSPNPGQMSELIYETGASTVRLIGLANANFKSMTFSGGAGSYSLDFGGQLRTSADVKIEAGAGSVRIAVPSTAAVEVTVGGSLNDVSIDGPWANSDKVYSTPAVSDTQAKRLSITLEINVGTVDLVAQ